MPTPREGYRTADGQKVPSVTTILGRFKDSGGLIKWAYKQGREHENLAMRKLPAPAHLYDRVQEAAQAGTIAHDMIEQHVLQGWQELDLKGFTRALYPEVKSAVGAAPEILARAQNAYLQFVQWLANSKLVITKTEMGSVSERHRFGGTLDAIGRDSAGRVVLIDWKTSNAVYGDMLCQLAAYALLLEENYPEHAPQGFHLLRVAKESADFAHHYYGELEREKRAFLLMRELYELVYAIERRA